MAVDEFGREIQGSHHDALGSGGDNALRSAPPLRGRSRSFDAALPDDHVGGGGYNNNNRMRRGRNSISPSPEGRGRKFSRDYHDDDGYSNGHHRGSLGGGGRHANFSHRRSRGESFDHDDRHHHHRRGRSHSRGGGRRDDDMMMNMDHHRGSSSGRSRSKRMKPNASERYAEEPMLCQFLWRKELEDEEAKKYPPPPSPQQRQEDRLDGGAVEENAEKHDLPMVPTEEGDDNIKSTNTDDTNNNANEHQPPPHQHPPLFESDQEATQAYTIYNHKYCLNYIRTFFNSHLDDPWFRHHLSPLVKYRQATAERTRSNVEANEIKKEILYSLEESNLGVIPKKDPDCPEYLGSPKCSFVSGCRLGVGTKPSNLLLMRHYHRQYDDYNEGGKEEEQQQQQSMMALQGEDRNRIERHAKSHLHSFIKSDACVKIMDVPSHCTNEQIMNALMEYCTVKPLSGVWSGEVYVPTAGRDGGNGMDPYHRTVFVVFSSREAKESMLDNLNRSNEDSNRHSRDRHDKDRLPRVLDLVVDCTDVYGRREMDADGKGGAPPPPPSVAGEPKAKQVETKLPTKQCAVFLSTATLSSSQPVSVLSAAVSSRERISRDKEAATTIATILDRVREISQGNRLVDLLKLLFPGEGELASVDDEDILDVSVAYLRRVHLFSFYNGCCIAENVGNVLTHSHPVGTIHLRLRNADDILRKAAEERGIGVGGGAMDEGEEEGGEVETAPTTVPNVENDMLVMRLNSSIAKALDHVKMLEERGPAVLVDEETDAAAKAIEENEQNAKMNWIENHGLVDEDGRARCSFHFCRKLFKDRAFLHKHLQKKHADHLRAECAKCHDHPMMIAWDGDEKRPVPPIQIDCGSKFGLVPSAVIGSAEPTAHDPEPELWKEEEARMMEEERRRQERQEAAEAAARAEELEHQRRQEEMNAGEKRKGNFVDVDDMVEEKVELSFENVEVAPPPKKKKKKKSLL